MWISDRNVCENMAGERKRSQPAEICGFYRKRARIGGRTAQAEPGLTQQALTDAAQLHVNQVKRYESGSAQPTLEGLIKLAQALHVSLDELVFEEGERGPSDKMQLLFEAVERLDEKEQSVIREPLEGMIIKYEARHWSHAS